MFAKSRWMLSIPVIAILASHYMVDIYSSMIPPLIGVVETEFMMKPAWAAFLLGMGSICSGLSQPLFAWISDKTESRIYGPLGIFLAAIGVCSIGYLRSIPMLFLIYSIAMMGIGMFHPIATARIGKIAGDQRGFAISIFFVFGMAGFCTGSLLGPYLTTGDGSLQSLVYLVLPGLVLAAFLHWNINQKMTGDMSTSDSISLRDANYDWFSISLLYVSACFRFLVNMAIVYLIVRWVEQYVRAANPQFSADQVSDFAAPIAGFTQAIMFVGQGTGGLLAGVIIKTGHEKLPLVLTPICFGPFLCALAFLQPGNLALVACFLGGIGFAAMTPITISTGQQLMPHHTRLASGLLLGGAWAVASVGPRLAEYLIQTFDLETAIITIGLFLVLAGLSVTGIKTSQSSKLA